MPAPLLSVVIPAHDAAEWVEELLDSVLAQDIAAMEVLVVDDRSTDATAELVATVAAKDDRVVLLPSSTPGGAGARNTGAVAARGEYLVFADADDLVPTGSYRAMVDSLERSGADLAVGDHLKFSPNRTWSPTERWHLFDHAAQRTTLAETPALLTGRACWNRVFRKSFWEGAGLAFPDVGHADDIVPMTRSVLLAEAIDVVPVCVYLYRERAGGVDGSMSNRTDERSFIDYLVEETTCASLVATASPAIIRQQSLLVLDADGWVHLDRYLAQLPEGAVVPDHVRHALSGLLDELDASVLDEAAPHRRCLFALVWSGRFDIAAEFVAAFRADPTDPRRLLDGWVAALGALLDAPALVALDRGALATDGMLTAFLHSAEAVPDDELRPLVETAGDVLRRTPAGGDRSELLAAMRRAVLTGDLRAARRVSALRHHAPVVVDRVTPTRDSLLLEGPAPSDRLGDSMRFTARSADEVVAIDLQTGDGRWSGRITADRLPPTRWTTSVTFAISTIEVEVPLVTARMPLPPLDDEHLLQPLSDRRDGWRFLVDRRSARTLLSRARSFVRRRRTSRDSPPLR